jgi:hypothetical protein
MGFTKLGDPFVRSCLILWIAFSPSRQVGPVLDKFELGGVPYEGQYIVAGFSGHGMPRAFGWFVSSFLSVYPNDRISQCGHRGADDTVQDGGQRVGVTAVAPTTLSYDPRPLTSGIA